MKGEKVREGEGDRFQGKGERESAKGGKRERERE